MGHYVGVHTTTILLWKIETNGEATRTGIVVIVWDNRDTG
jgi:hypothetical protein